MVDGRIRRGSIATAVGAAILVGLIGAGGGCSLVIGGAVPAFECLGGDNATECPGDQVCDPGTHKCVEPCSVTGCAGSFTCDPGSNTCVPLADAGDDGPTVVEAEASTPDTGPVDATSRDQEAGPVETGPPVEAGCTGIGCPCTGNSSCAAGLFCADSSLVPTGILTAAGNNFCTEACCTSNDCKTNGAVCYATGGYNAAGGNYCVLPAWLQRSSAGSALGGASCTSGETCRSGLCVDSACADTCCSTNETGEAACASGTSCRFATFPGIATDDQNYVAWCGQGGSGKNEANCQHNSDCESELCGGTLAGCANACRNTADCGDPQESCAYVTPASPSTAVIAACFSGAGNGAVGSACNNDDQCASQFCDTTAGKCTDVCFANSDCSSNSCVPSSFTLQGGGKVTVMACAP